MSSGTTATIDNDLVFITYDNTSDGRKHNSTTSRIIRQRAFQASKDEPKIHHRMKTSTLKNHTTKFRLSKSSESTRTLDAQSTDEPVLLQQVSPFKPVVGPLGDDAWKLLGYCTQAILPAQVESTTH
jgi:hypothetical protein